MSKLRSLLFLLVGGARRRPGCQCLRGAGCHRSPARVDGSTGGRDSGRVRRRVGTLLDSVQAGRPAPTPGRHLVGDRGQGLHHRPWGIQLHRQEGLEGDHLPRPGAADQARTSQVPEAGLTDEAGHFGEPDRGTADDAPDRPARPGCLEPGQGQQRHGRAVHPGPGRPAGQAPTPEWLVVADRPTRASRTHRGLPSSPPPPGSTATSPSIGRSPKRPRALRALRRPPPEQTPGETPDFSDKFVGTSLGADWVQRGQDYNATRHAQVLEGLARRGRRRRRSRHAQSDRRPRQAKEVLGVPRRRRRSSAGTSGASTDTSPPSSCTRSATASPPHGSSSSRDAASTGPSG